MYISNRVLGGKSLNLVAHLINRLNTEPMHRLNSMNRF